MPKRLSKPKRPTDINELAHQLIRESTEEAPEPEKPTRSEISRIMAAMGRKGGKKSAKVRMITLSKDQRREIASNAAKRRWEQAAKKQP